jgi:hypothetical protein
MYDAKAVAVVVEVAKAEILADVARGVVPADVPSFAELHDHVDANEYGGGTESFDGSAEACAFWNRVHDTLDAWIKAGALRR